MRVLLLNALGGLRGGSQRTTRTIARALTDAGHYVLVGCPPGAFSESLIDAGIPTTAIDATAWLGGRLHQAGAANAARTVALCRRERIDVIHTFQYGSHLLARVVAGALEVGAVHTVIGPLSPGQRFASGPMMAISEAFRDDAIAVGADAHQVVVAPQQLDLTHFGEPLPPAEDPVVALIGRLDGHLAHAAEHFLRAVPLVQCEARFVVAGDGEHLDRLRGATGVRFLGHVRDIRSVHRTARVVIGVGLSIVEAMAAGIPCINLAPVGCGGIVGPQTVAEMARHNMSGRHATSSEPAVLAATIDRLLSDGPERQRLAQWGPGWVRGRYDVLAGVPEFERAYAAAVAQPPPVAETGRLLARLTASKTARTLRRLW